MGGALQLHEREAEPAQAPSSQELEQRAAALAAEVERRTRAEAIREQLYDLVDAMSRAETLEQVHDPSLEAVCSLLRVERAAVLLVDPNGVMRFRAWRGLSEAFRQAVEGHSPWSCDARDPEPILVPDVKADEALASYQPLFAREGIGALGFVPLCHHGILLGKLMIYENGPRRFSSDDAQLASTIAAQIAQAVARASLLTSERRARAQAELLAERSNRLQTITGALAGTATLDEACEALVVEGAAATGASTAGLWLVNDAQPRADLIHSLGYDDDRAAPFRRIPLDGSARSPVADVIASGEPLWLDCRKSFEREYPGIAAAPRDPEIALACLPLMAERRCAGVLAFTFAAARDFPADERSFLLVLARYGAQAVGRARLFDLEHLARERAEAAQRRSALLLEASVVLSSSLDYGANLERLAQLVVPRLCDWCAIELEDEPDEPPRALAIAHVDPQQVEQLREARRQASLDLNAERGVANVLRTGRPELDAKMIVVPIAARGRIFGAITLSHGEADRRFGPADLELAELLGHRAGIAVDNARLFENAQAATRAREEVLDVVSHDLRNPLGVVLMSASSLLRTELEGPSAPRIRKRAETIQRAAERMSRLIEDLGDFASMQSGRVRVERRPCSPQEIVFATVEMFAALAHDREIRLETRVESAMPDVSCDHDRIVQALGNIVSNAVKVTGAGGTVTVGARRSGAELIFFVEDHGPGLKPEELPRIFERYWRSERAVYRGKGLGLTIAKGIVDAHEGRLWAETEPGVGSRFLLALKIDGAG